MKDVPMLSAVRNRRLPTPTVQTMHAMQPVDLKPYGNTVALTTTAQNPFTQSHSVSVHTQASGGMAKAPKEMQSQRLLNSFLPDMGADPNEANQGTPTQESGGVWSGVTSAVEDVTGVFAERERAKAELARAKAAEAEARAAGDTARADMARSRVDQLIAMMGGARGARTTSNVLLYGGLALLGVAGFMWLQQNKGGKKTRRRRRR